MIRIGNNRHAVSRRDALHQSIRGSKRALSGSRQERIFCSSFNQKYDLRCLFVGGEGIDWLFHTVVENLKVLATKPSDEMTVRIRYGHAHVHAADIHANRAAG